MAYHRYAGHRCSAPGCPGRARGITPLCPKCDDRSWYWGDPKGRRITKKMLEPYRKRWLKFKAKNDGHHTIVTAAAVLDRFYKTPEGLFTRRRDWSLHTELRYQNDHGATGEEALDWLVALHLMWAWNCPEGMASKNGRLAQLGYRVLHVKSRGTVDIWSPSRGSMSKRSPTIKRRTRTLRLIGKRVDDYLIRFFLNVENAIAQQDRAEVEERETLETPFTEDQPNEQEAA